MNRTVPHRPRRLAPEQLAELAAWVEAAPDQVCDGVVRWRRKDMQHRIVTAFGVALHERSLFTDFSNQGISSVFPVEDVQRIVAAVRDIRLRL